VVLITDSSIGAGLPAGTYPTPWGFSVRVVPGQGARIADSQHSDSGALAASALTLNAAVGNVLRWLDLPAEQVWAMATANPARVAGLTDRGRIEVGTRADLVLWNESLTPARVWVAGQEIYRREVGA
jgi:N-acetylglucosamine-6-phosphate deacetylase